jgi:hypothetical protein
MSKLITSIIVILLILGGVWWYMSNNDSGTEPVVTPSSEQAELVAFGFLQDFVKVAPPETDAEAMTRAYEALSTNAKARVSVDNLSSDLAGFVGVQDVPDMGMSVEDLQILSENESILIAGLNYSGGRILKGVYMIVEDGEWKVEGVVDIQQTEESAEVDISDTSDEVVVE